MLLFGKTNSNSIKELTSFIQEDNKNNSLNYENHENYSLKSKNECRFVIYH
jgi:hypothetical protein